MQIVYRLLALALFAAFTLVTHAQGRGREDVSAEETLSAVVHVVSRRPFSGSWEYMLDAAIFTYPAVMNWSGASLINAKGELLGLGSLIVADSAGSGSESPGCS